MSMQGRRGPREVTFGLCEDGQPPGFGLALTPCNLPLRGASSGHRMTGGAPWHGAACRGTGALAGPTHHPNVVQEASWGLPPQGVREESYMRRLVHHRDLEDCIPTPGDSGEYPYGKCMRKSHWFVPLDDVEKCNKCMESRPLLRRILEWRNMDGDGITDPLRGEIMRAVGREEGG